ncbi:hypothetical protein [Haloarchaeobius sp. DYHT-AS-18]|uniref:hypothetical protein n=1 Tax=Haloarchaeobius sp. DYHT-AS-18 TaxID=3446117 RepID=UPI003EB8F785
MKSAALIVAVIAALLGATSYVVGVENGTQLYYALMTLGLVSLAYLAAKGRFSASA